jgi:hypothetical protein
MDPTPAAAADRHQGILPRVLLHLTLGFLTTAAVVIALSHLIPIQKAPPRVAIDGDHLQPWLIQLSFPGARRTIWFEKGRIYNHAGVGPQGGSSAAVSCWSFATSTRNDPRLVRGEIEVPPEVQEPTQSNPQVAWGGCLDERGWPFPAAKAGVLGIMDPKAPAIYRIDWGVQLKSDTTTNSRNSLADVRVVPWRPIWTGLLLNTAIFSAAWWALLLVPRTIIARRRSRRGVCPKCGYDLAGLATAVCPECGTASA